MDNIDSIIINMREKETKINNICKNYEYMLQKCDQTIDTDAAYSDSDKDDNIECKLLKNLYEKCLLYQKTKKTIKIKN